jgi:hypothetical protein
MWGDIILCVIIVCDCDSVFVKVIRDSVFVNVAKFILGLMFVCKH